MLDTAFLEESEFNLRFLKISGRRLETFEMFKDVQRSCASHEQPGIGAKTSAASTRLLRLVERAGAWDEHAAEHTTTVGLLALRFDSLQFANEQAVSRLLRLIRAGVLRRSADRNRHKPRSILQSSSSRLSRCGGSALASRSRLVGVDPQPPWRKSRTGRWYGHRSDVARG